MDQQAIPQIMVTSPLQEDDSMNDPLVRRDGTFDMRMVNLANFPLNSSAYRPHYRSHNNLIARAKANLTTSPAKSLDLLRQALQKSVNRELDQVIRKYLDLFFKPAIRNIRENGGSNSISDYHVQAICRQVLDEAKKMYFSGSGISNGHQHSNSYIPTASPVNPLSEVSDSEVSVQQCKKRGRGDVESDDSGNEGTSDVKVRRGPKKYRKRVVEAKQHSKSKGSADTNNCGRTGFRWDPERLTESTKFVLGSRANKALGFGMTRGRLYTKHADLFRYIGDMEDKQWLSERGLMPTSGGRAYLLLKQDIEDLIETSDYCGVPGVDASEMGTGFTVPKKMISKMRALMESMRTDSVSPKSHVGSENRDPDSRPDSAVSKREDYGDGDVDGEILLNSNDPSSPADSCKRFSPPDSLPVIEQYL